MKDIFHWLHILIWCNFVFALITIKLLLHYFSGKVWPVLYNPLKDKRNSIFYEISFLNFLIKDEQGLPCTLPALFVLLHSVISPLTNDPSFKILGPRLNNYVFSCASLFRGFRVLKHFVSGLYPPVKSS